MADLWTDDLAALDARAHHQLRSIAATRASVLAKATEPKMRFLKHHPILAALAAVLLLAIAAPLTYAAVTRLFITFDPTQSAPEIENSVQQQLQNADVQADVHADKGSDGVTLWIKSDDPNVGSNLAFDIAGSGVMTFTDQRRIVGNATCHLTDDQTMQFAKALSAPETFGLEGYRGSDGVYVIPADGSGAPAVNLGGGSAADVVAGLRTSLTASGFHDVDIAVGSDTITVTVTAPPHP